jgi:hypothetical protein
MRSRIGLRPSGMMIEGRASSGTTAKERKRSFRRPGEAAMVARASDPRAAKASRERPVPNGSVIP